ncbi:MAG: cysteine hydrolase family protein [Armatimonadetes bacterium]|nr:cysteine hydrolase family protein [Armatimonadota bacterium]
MRSALIVVDVQNDFAHPAGWVGRRGGLPPSTQAAVARINALIDAARLTRLPVYYVRVEHGPEVDAPSYRARYAARGFAAGELL